jgi:hypothetical protein
MIFFRFFRLVGLADDGQDVILIKDFVFLAVEFDFSAAVFIGQDDVAFFHFKGNLLAVVVGFAGAQCDDFVFLRFFFRGIGDNYSALFHFGLFNRFHKDPIAKGFNL